MAIFLNPALPVIAAQAAAPDLVLQPGTVIDAQVLKLLASDLVRIAIANLSLEVFSEIPLQVGQTLRLAVSQTSDGIKLAVLGPNNVVPNQDTTASTADAAASHKLAPSDPATRAPDLPALNAIQPTAARVTSPLTALEALAVSAAAQTAATSQASLAPLFANLAAVAGSDALPPKLQQAIARLLELRPSADTNLTAGDLQAAFKRSGLFLESSLASDLRTPSPSGAPDLKAALIVLRQTLLSLGSPAAREDAPALPGTVVSSAATTAIPPEASTAQAAPELQIAASPALAPSSIPETDVEEVLLPQARLPTADEFSEADGQSRIFAVRGPPPNGRAALRATITEAAFNPLRETLQPAPLKSRDHANYLNESAPFDPSSLADGPQRATSNGGIATARTNMPPPPFRGALPSAQPIVPASIAADAPLAAVAHRLLGDTEAAIARQTLLQIASLPDRGELTAPRADLATPRWAFEIPFATAAGTAIAQFEISRDSGATAIEAAKQVWRARFSVDVEPAGPVHALVSWSGDATSVRIWAERPATAGQLRAGASQLAQALNRAELQPGDIVIRQGAPTQSVSAPAGHFLDRAL